MNLEKDCPIKIEVQAKSRVVKLTIGGFSRGVGPGRETLGGKTAKSCSLSLISRKWLDLIGRFQKPTRRSHENKTGENRGHKKGNVFREGWKREPT